MLIPNSTRSDTEATGGHNTIRNTTFYLGKHRYRPGRHLDLNMWSSQCLLLLAVFFTDVSTFVSSSTTELFTFRATSQCWDSRCLSLVYMKVRSRAECAVTCGYSPTCAGFYHVSRGSCFHIQGHCFLNSSCPEDVSLYRKHTYQQPCLNNGTWNQPSGACSCINGWVGSRCERKAYTCQELHTFGYPAGWHNVEIDVYKNQSLMADTKCSIGDTWWRTLIFSNDARGDYNRSWADYQRGFQNGSWNTWMGLESVHAFNQMGHRTVTFAVAVQPSTFVWEFVYENFSMSDASSGYAFTYSRSFNRTLGNYYLTAGSCLEDVLSLAQGMPFSTFDRDQDKDSENCAALQGAGWWIDTCTTGQHINPLGLNPKFSPFVSELNKLSVPRVNISDQAIMDNFQSVFMTFID